MMRSMSAAFKFAGNEMLSVLSEAAFFLPALDSIGFLDQAAELRQRTSSPEGEGGKPIAGFPADPSYFPA